MPGIVRTQIGEMRSKVEMLKNVPTDATTGGAIDHYGIIVTTRGRLRKRSGQRDLSFGDIVDAESYELTMRYQVDIENNLRIDTKFLINGLVYSINSWELFQEVKFYYKVNIAINKGGSVTIVAPSPINPDIGVKSVWLTTTPGQSTVSNNLFIGTTILGVEREGTGLTKVSGTPVNREFSFSGNTITVDATNPFNAGEMIYVLYKIGS